MIITIIIIQNKSSSGFSSELNLLDEDIDKTLHIKVSSSAGPGPKPKRNLRRRRICGYVMDERRKDFAATSIFPFAIIFLNVLLFIDMLPVTLTYFLFPDFLNIFKHKKITVKISTNRV